MWISKQAFSFFGVTKDLIQQLREDMSALKAERDAYKEELTRTHIMNDFLRMKVNSLELEKSLLTQKAFNISLPVPEIARRPMLDPSTDPRQFSLDDMGDELARKLGFPAHDLTNN